MEKKNNCVKVGFSTILCIVMAILLCVAPSLRADVDIPNDGVEYNIPGNFGPTISGNLNVYGTVNLLTGALVQQALKAYPDSVVNIWPSALIKQNLNAYPNSVVNIYGGNVNGPVSVFDGAKVTVYGTDFAVDGVPDPLATEFTPVPPPEGDGTAVLTGNYENGDSINLLFYSDIAINLVNTAGDTTPPVITCPGDITVVAMSPEGVSVDDERIQTFLAGATATDDCDEPEEIIITNDAPSVFLPRDTVVVTFTATDTSGNWLDCYSTVTVVEATEEGRLRIIPPIINREGRLTKILAVIRFPEGTTEDDIDMAEPLVLFAGYSPYDIVSTNQRIVSWCRWGTLRVSIFAFFDKDEIMAAVPEDGPVEFMVIGRFVNGDYFYGTNTVRIVSWDWTWW